MNHVLYHRPSCRCNWGRCFEGLKNRLTPKQEDELFDQAKKIVDEMKLKEAK